MEKSILLICLLVCILSVSVPAAEIIQPGTEIKEKLETDKETFFVVIEKKIYFTSNKAEIDPNAYYLLDKISNYIKNNSDCKVELSGHSDDAGGIEYNAKLSRERAENVLVYFVNIRNFPASIFTVIGLGNTKPVFSNSVNEGRLLNRSVEIVIRNKRREEKRKPLEEIDKTEVAEEAAVAEAEEDEEWEGKIGEKNESTNAMVEKPKEKSAFKTNIEKFISKLNICLYPGIRFDYEAYPFLGFDVYSNIYGKYYFGLQFLTMNYYEVNCGEYNVESVSAKLRYELFKIKKDITILPYFGVGVYGPYNAVLGGNFGVETKIDLFKKVSMLIGLNFEMFDYYQYYGHDATDNGYWYPYYVFTFMPYVGVNYRFK